MTTNTSGFDLETATMLYDIVSQGLVSGLGEAIPGKLCIEAAVCLALGEPHGDAPSCVGVPDRNFSIRLNDAPWSSPEVRAAGLRDLAIAQLGSADLNTDQRIQWCQYLAEHTIRKILPVALRASASMTPSHAAALEAAALRCEKDGDKAAADNAASTVYASAATAITASTAAVYATATAASIVSSTDITYTYASYASAASAASYAADASYASYASYAATAGDSVLTLAAQIAVDAYRFTGAPGIALLDQINRKSR